MDVRRPLCVLFVCWIVGCDRAPAPTAEPASTTTTSTSASSVVALAKVLVDGVALDVPPPFVRVVDRGTMVDVEISSEPFATTRPTTAAAGSTPAETGMPPTTGAPLTTGAAQTNEGAQTTGYHFLMNVPVASVDDLGAAEWTQTLSAFPEDSAEGFFVDDGHVQIVPATVRASFTPDGPSLTIHLRGTCFKRSDEADAQTKSVDVDATFVAGVRKP